MNPILSFGPVVWRNILNYIEYSAKAIKKVDSRIQVGGPVICEVNTKYWLRSFIEHCIKNELPLDFISRQLPFTKPKNKLREECCYESHCIFR